MDGDSLKQGVFVWEGYVMRQPGDPGEGPWEVTRLGLAGGSLDPAWDVGGW